MRKSEKENKHVDKHMFVMSSNVWECQAYILSTKCITDCIILVMDKSDPFDKKTKVLKPKGFISDSLSKMCNWKKIYVC